MGHYEESRSVEEINKTMVLMRGIGKKGNFLICDKTAVKLSIQRRFYGCSAIYKVADFLANSLEYKRSMRGFTSINVLLLIFYRQIVAR